jgi:hypothetical protein
MTLLIDEEEPGKREFMTVNEIFLYVCLYICLFICAYIHMSIHVYLGEIN